MGFFRDLVRLILGSPEPEPEPVPIPDLPTPVPTPEPAPADPPLSPEPEPEPVAALPIASHRPRPPGGRGRASIPSLKAERTRLIDRAMLTLGLLTPEALAEIHRVGDAMDRARPVGPPPLPSGGRGDKAARLERARARDARRDEAAARRLAHAEAVAHSHATEIRFLGRGVSKFLGDHRVDRAALEAAGLPVLATPAELAEALGLSVSRLRWLAFHAEAATRVHYVSFEVPKKSGGTRTLKAPHRTLAAAQRWVAVRIVAPLPVEPEAHGFVAGRSILTNASPHAGRAVVVNMDLEDFFPSVGYRRVRSVFRRLGYSPSVATVLGLICTECPRRTVVLDGTTYHVATGPRGLPQGASTSPGLSNQVARRLDRRLAGLAGKLGATYTRYADDLTFSGDATLDPKVGYLIARVRHLAEAEGFRLNQAKTRVLRRNAAQVVTGLVVNDRPGVPRDEVRRLKAILHRARLEGLDAQNRQDHPDFRAWLRGKIAYVAMSRPEVGARLLAEFSALEGIAGSG